MNKLRKPKGTDTARAQLRVPLASTPSKRGAAVDEEKMATPADSGRAPSLHP